MSEFQYYEFRVIDRQLTRDEMAAMRRVSSRGEITPTSYTNTYDFGDFKGDPERWMDSYFDAFLYYANWGTRTFKLKLPASSLDPEVVKDYCCNECVSVRTIGDHVVVTVDGAEYSQWDDWTFEWSLADIIGLRDELARGDLRCLYLAWLIDGVYDTEDMDVKDDGSDIEPPVPPGLGQLTESQRRFVELFDINPDLIGAAAHASPPLEPKQLSRADYHSWLKALPQAEKDELLTKLVEENGRTIAIELAGRFSRETSPTPSGDAGAGKRTVKELYRLMVDHREDRIRREEEAASAARKRRLDDLASRLPQVWSQVEELAASKKVNLYNEAIPLLVGLRDLAARGDIPDWKVRMSEFRMRHQTKKALLGLLDRAGI
jgi:hypothetical protein